MKRLLTIATCFVAIMAVLASCEKKDTPDAKCGLESFSLTHSPISSVPVDIKGIIDDAAGTISLVKPVSVNTNSFIATFTATQYDVVKIGGTVAESGVTVVQISNGTKVNVSDDVSAMTKEYTIVLTDNDEAAELVSVAFKASDNSLLDTDVIPDAIASEMVVRVPGEAFRQELTMTVTAGFNDAIKVNNEAVASGSSIKVDTSFPIDIVVTDEVAGVSASYVVKVGKILQVIVTKLGTYSEGTINDMEMTINPTDNLPYLVYTRKVGDEKNNNVSVAKWDGNAFSLLGESGLADASARSASKPRLAFASDGTAYVTYLAADVAAKPTVKKLDSEWVTVGEAGITPNNCNSTNAYPFFIHPATSRPAFFWCGNSKNVASYRTMNYTGWSGESWTSNVVSGIPELGSDNSTGNYYTSSLVIVGSKVYIGSSFNRYGYFVHEVGSDGSLTPVVDNFTPDGESYGLPANLQLAAGSEGELYLMGGMQNSGVMQIFRVDAGEKTLKAYGEGISVSVSSNGGISQDVAFGIKPDTGLVIAAYDTDTTNNIPSFVYMNDNLQWDSFSVDSPAAAKSAYRIRFDKDGKGYISYVSADGIELYAVGLEADILPE